ncbi:MAG: histidine phosphatase family protein [Bacteroidota bacterium]
MPTIHLIRHGQASYFQADYDQLSETGITQSRILGQTLRQRKVRVDQLVGGTLKRHRRTARYAWEALDREMDYREDPRWNEYDHQELIARHRPELGDFARLAAYVAAQKEPRRALQELLEGAMRDWMEDACAYTTPWTEFKAQANAVLQELAGRLGKSESAWVFTSGGPISVVILELLNLPDDQFLGLLRRLVNTSITKILVGRQGLSLSTYNGYGHLEHDPRLLTYR